MCSSTITLRWPLLSSFRSHRAAVKRPILYHYSFRIDRSATALFMHLMVLSTQGLPKDHYLKLQNMYQNYRYFISGTKFKLCSIHHFALQHQLNAHSIIRHCVRLLEPLTIYCSIIRVEFARALVLTISSLCYCFR